MALVKTTLSLTAQDRQWIDGIIDSGEFVSSSEYVRNLIRRDKEQRCQIEAIRAKLINAEQSGFVNQAADEILNDIKNAARSNGNL
ncbi:type II toxin-antitoxin system ParD family antitoxin [bacterium]|nr:type II toxin-antitoxin system ParD family antitoxin [bacterium]